MLFNWRALIFTFSGTHVRIAEHERRLWIIRTRNNLHHRHQANNSKLITVKYYGHLARLMLTKFTQEIVRALLATNHDLYGAFWEGLEEVPCDVVREAIEQLVVHLHDHVSRL